MEKQKEASASTSCGLEAGPRLDREESPASSPRRGAEAQELVLSAVETVDGRVDGGSHSSGDDAGDEVSTPARAMSPTTTAPLSSWCTSRRSPVRALPVAMGSGGGSRASPAASPGASAGGTRGGFLKSPSAPLLSQ